MFSFISKYILSRSILLAFLFVVLFAASIFAFSEPGSLPPADNVAAPLNVSNVWQTKKGPLTLNTESAAVGLSVAAGNVGIGTLTPLYQLDTTNSARFYNLLVGITAWGSDWAGLAHAQVPNPGSSYALVQHSSGMYTWLNKATGGNFQIRDGNSVSQVNVDGSGNMQVLGTISSGQPKTFKISHPLDPEEKYLVHASLEGPEAGVYYRGEGRLENGRAEIRLPDYFEALTRKDGRTVFLTNIDGGDRIYVKTEGGTQVRDGIFVVLSDDTASRQRFNWQVYAVRGDIPPVEVEALKSDDPPMPMPPE